MIKGPLTGVRVLDVTIAHAGPFGAKLLGDLGAEVLKIEPPKYGEVTRRLAPFAGDPALGMASYIVALSRNKKSVGLDLYTESGREAFRDLVKVSDVVYDNQRPEGMKRIGVDYDTVRKINPRIISCSIQGYGTSGPYLGRPSYDDIAQGISGMTSLCGEEGGNPIRSPVALADISAGMFSVIGIITALYEREHTGKGRRVEVNLLDACMSLMSTHYAIYGLTGKVPGRQGSKHPTSPMLGVFKTKDGYVTMGPSWPRIMRIIGREDAIDDPRFNTPAKRYENRMALERMIEEGLEKETTEVWQAIFEVEDIAGGPLNTMDKALADPQIVHNKAAITLEHPKYGKIQNTECPIKILDAIEGEHTPPPLVGEHTEEVLKGIMGYSEDKIRRLNEEAEKHSEELKSHVQRIA